MPLPEKVTAWFDNPYPNATPDSLFFMGVTGHPCCRTRVFNQINLDDIKGSFGFTCEPLPLSHVRLMVEWIFDNVNHPFLYEAHSDGRPGTQNKMDHVLGFTDPDEAALFKLSWFVSNSKKS